MDYQRIYDRLICSRQKLERSKSDNCYYESHHIIPTCLNGSNDESNLVLLTAREHFVAHRLLTKIHPKNQKLLFAVAAFRTLKKQRKLTSRQFEAVRKANAEALSLRNQKLAAKGKHNFQTEEHREASAKRQRDLAAEGKHNSQTEEAREATSQRNRDLAAKGEHPTQTNEFREAQSKRNRDLAAAGRHPSQTKEFREALMKRNSDLAAEGKHNFQTEEHSKAAAKQMKAIVTCPHCGKSGGSVVMKRWHFDKCKSITSL